MSLPNPTDLAALVALVRDYRSACNALFAATDQYNSLLETEGDGAEFEERFVAAYAEARRHEDLVVKAVVAIAGPPPRSHGTTANRGVGLRCDGSIWSVVAVPRDVSATGRDDRMLVETAEPTEDMARDQAG